MKINHAKRHKLTEHECNYKKYNMALLDSFIALHPPLMTKLCMAIFNIIMDTKRYNQQSSPYYSAEEERRIYSNKYVTLDDILNRCHPAKYGAGGK